MAKPFTNIQYVPRRTSPWGLGIPADAVLIHQDLHGRQYGWREEPVIPPSQAELDKMRDDMNETIRRIYAPPVIGNLDGSSRIKVSWEPDPAPEPDFFADYIRAAAEKRRRTIEQFLIFTFDITEEEWAFVEEVLAGKNISTITPAGRKPGKTRRAWAWERLMKRLHADPLPAWFWGNVHGYRMLEDTLGRDIIHTLTKDRA